MQTFLQSSRQKSNALRQSVLQQRKKQDVRQRLKQPQLQQHRKQQPRSLRTIHMRIPIQKILLLTMKMILIQKKLITVMMEIQ